MRFKHLLLIWVVVGLTVVTTSTQAQGYTSDVKIDAIVGGVTTVQISGYASPRASVIVNLVNSRAEIGKYPADDRAVFGGAFQVVLQGPDTLCLTVEDVSNIKTSPICFVLDAKHSAYVFEDIVFPPTIQVDQLLDGGGVRVSGFTLPGGTVDILLDNGLSYTTSANQFGYYSIEIEIIDNFEHTVVAKTTTINLTSGLSDAVSFSLKSGLASKYIFKQIPQNVCLYASEFIPRPEDWLLLLLIIIELLIIGYLEHRRHKHRKKLNEMLRDKQRLNSIPSK